MYTLVYLNGNLNRPDTLPVFLQSNVGKTALLQIDCVTPFQGTVEELVNLTSEHLNKINPTIEVSKVEVKNASAESKKSKQIVHFMVLHLLITKK